VNVQFKCKLKRIIPLSELKEQKHLQKMHLLQRGNRLSIMAVTQQEWDYILQLE